MKIAIIGTVKSPYFGQNLAYTKYLSLIGMPVTVTPDVDPDWLVSTFDLVVMPGGGDVEQTRYGGFSYDQMKPDICYEYFDAEVLPEILGKVPIFGICRGMQSVCVELGCSMRQHLELHPHSDPRDELVHKIYNKDNHKYMFWANSLHHQSVDIRGDKVIELAYSYEPTLLEKDDKEGQAEKYGTVTEIVAAPEHRFFGVQYHPEEMECWDTIALMKAYLKLQ
jgi:gamma-glutamyl-gamma-aminobutyrate hydrolase PuuD